MTEALYKNRVTNTGVDIQLATQEAQGGSEILVTKQGQLTGINARATRNEFY